MFDCPQCGETAEQLPEGVCPDCLGDNQTRLDQHNAQFDWWESLSDAERDRQIKLACYQTH
jgi:hypothetical protein